MKFLVVITSLVVLVHGKSQYNYQEPSGSYSSPSVGHSSGDNGGGSFGNGGYDNNNGFSGYGGGSSGGGYVSGGTTLVQKHIYVHVPPPEQESYPQRRPVVLPQAEKHYKIIFIKAPTAATPTAPALPPVAQNEEKTLVYVLVKKPEEAPEIIIPTAAPTTPSKPEVYFIRYKSKKESEGKGYYPDSNAKNSNDGNGNIYDGINGGGAVSDSFLKGKFLEDGNSGSMYGSPGH